MLLFLILQIRSDVYDEIGIPGYMEEVEPFNNGTVEWKSFIDHFNNDGKKLLKKYHYFNKLNLLFLGKAGAGKVTLIDEFFRWISGNTGCSRQITQKITEFSKRNCHLTIYNTIGLESAKVQQDSLQAEIYYLIKRQIQTNDPSNYIHCIFYCVNCASHCFEKEEEEFLKNIKNLPEIADIPIILVLTQCYSQEDKDSMIKKLSQLDLKVNIIIPILAKEKKLQVPGLKQSIIIPSYGISDLQDALDDLMINYYKDTFGMNDENNFNISIRHKRNRAYFAVGCVTLLNFLYSLKENPNALVYVSSNVGMIAWISSIYGIKIPNNVISLIVEVAINNSNKLNLVLKMPEYGCKFINFLIDIQLPACPEVAMTAAMGILLVNIIEDAYIQQVQYETVSGDKFGDIVKKKFIKKLENI